MQKLISYIFISRTTVCLNETSKIHNFSIDHDCTPPYETAYPLIDIVERLPRGCALYHLMVD